MTKWVYALYGLASLIALTVPVWLFYLKPYLERMKNAMNHEHEE